MLPQVRDELRRIATHRVRRRPRCSFAGSRSRASAPGNRRAERNSVPSRWALLRSVLIGHPAEMIGDDPISELRTEPREATRSDHQELIAVRLHLVRDPAGVKSGWQIEARE